MKKFILMMAVALPMAFASCGDDNDTEIITLDQTSVSLEYDKEVKVKASEKNCNWISDNEFVATVDNDGKIEAKHVGTCVITATKGKASEHCTVTVTATNNNFTIPVLLFGQNKAAIKTAVAAQNLENLQVYADSDEVLSYTTGTYYPFYIYSFEKNVLDASALVVTEEMDETLDLEEFLDQRYKYIEDTDDGFLYVNAMNLTNATLAVEYSFDPELGVQATWVNVDHTKAGSFINKAALKKVHAHAAKMAKK